MKTQILLAGKGGQGQVLAGIILAEAAVSYDGLHATQTQSYGPESRGGASRAEVIISDAPIDYPKVTDADLILCMSQEAYDRYAPELGRDGIILVDETLVSEYDADSPAVKPVPITELAAKEMGRVIVANMVALGVLVALTSVVSMEAARRAIENSVPPGTEELNLKAFELGVVTAEKLG